MVTNATSLLHECATAYPLCTLALVYFSYLTSPFALLHLVPIVLIKLPAAVARTVLGFFCPSLFEKSVVTRATRRSIDEMLISRTNPAPVGAVSRLLRRCDTLGHMRTLLIALYALTSHCALLRLPAMQAAVAAAAAAAVIGGAPRAHADLKVPFDFPYTFDKDACIAKYAKAPSVCFTMERQAKATAQNEARLARAAQCDADVVEIKGNKGEMPANVKPATANPNLPATCVGAPTYQLDGYGDPSLPGIYGDPTLGK